MDYNLPDLPKGMRWKIKPSILSGCTDLILQRKGLFGWRKVDWAVISNSSFNQWVTFHANRLVKDSTTPIQYGTKEGTL